MSGAGPAVGPSARGLFAARAASESNLTFRLKLDFVVVLFGLF
jgi:hypothetical protein